MTQRPNAHSRAQSILALVCVCVCVCVCVILGKATPSGRKRLVQTTMLDSLARAPSTVSAHIQEPQMYAQQVSASAAALGGPKNVEEQEEHREGARPTELAQQELIKELRSQIAQMKSARAAQSSSTSAAPAQHSMAGSLSSSMDIEASA